MKLTMNTANWNLRTRRIIRRLWMKHAMKGVAGGDAHDRLDRAYAIEDPWNLESEMERARFDWTNGVIRDRLGEVDRVLEIGCGEGHQSEYLQLVCRRVHGIDVSARAIERARHRVPSAQFAVADIARQPWGDGKGSYDLVTACEVLYYVRDLDATLERMSHLGRHCLVTIFAPAARRIAGTLERRIGNRRDWHFHGGTVWLAGWWSNE
jgi:SAM-dependent methyltransferase